MPLYWLCYRHNNQISVVIEPGASIIHARLRASLDGLDVVPAPSASDGKGQENQTDDRILKAS